MEPPFLVQRDGKKILATVPIAQLFQIQRAARKLMWQAIVMGDAQAKQQVEQMFMSLQPSDPKAVIMTLVLQDACAEAEGVRLEMQMAEQQKLREAESRDAAAYRAQQAAQKNAGVGGAPGGSNGGPGQQGPAQQVAGVPGAPQGEQDRVFCPHGIPRSSTASNSSVRCLECESAQKSSGAGRNQTERAQ